jgi:hypothetical protein
MGLLNAKKPIPKKSVKPLKKPNLKAMKETEPVDTTVTEEENCKIANTDVNDNSKIEFVGGENLENEKKSETEESKEKIVESLEVKDENNNTTLTIDSEGEVEETSAPVEEIKAEVETKTKKKTTRKRTTKKAKENKEDKEAAVITDANEAEEYLQDILNYTTEEWEEEENALRNKLKELTVRADLNPDEIRVLLGKLSESYIEVKDRLISTERVANSLEKKIKDVKTLAALEGTNQIERNANAVRAITCFKKDPKDEKGVDLEQYLLMLKHKVNFYDYCVKAMEYNRQLLITFSSVFKIEINNY